ncbi:hypothetical protein SELMODRAFT_430726 [Selaginella moellendorffii]|uniref:Uncharacterized protein n=1 Tax=Selaginella moellendorffii TaxID=88036 RepID=D8TAB5_SELML|nr:hypothetical protein SELMODRAFT_430726 [Selaginella moellendorffii]
MKMLSLDDSIDDHLKWAFPKAQMSSSIEACVKALEEDTISTLKDLRDYDYSSFPGKYAFKRHLACIVPLVTTWSEAVQVGSCLRDWWLPLKDDPSYLWNEREAYRLLWLGAIPPKEQTWWSCGQQQVYLFIGRTISHSVYEGICGLEGETYLRLVGAKGSGKTLVVASVCSHIQQAGLKQIVYLDAKSYIHEPLPTLRGALLLAFYGKEKIWLDILKEKTLPELENWCRYSGGDKLVFVVDDWESLHVKNAVEDPDAAKKSEAKQSILRARQRHPLVVVASVNSKEHLFRLTDDREALVDITSRLELDGPFSDQELMTWLGITKLPIERQQDMEFLTGGMPRLLNYFKVSLWDVEKYLTHIHLPYTSKLWSELIKKLNTVEELEAASRLILQGNLKAELEHVNQTCFFTEGTELSFLCPYLQVEAKRLLLARYREVEAALATLDIKEWVNVVKLDLIRQQTPQRTPRIGWNMEGLLIDVMQYQGRVFMGDDTTAFKHVMQYPKGGEKQTCLCLQGQDRELEEGVLLVPKAYNEKAIDLLLVKVRNGTTLIFYALQISVAKWKLKSKKKSHLVWKSVVLPAWKEAMTGYSEYEVRYYYIMPENIKQTDLPPDEQDEEIVPIVDVQFKKLSDVRDDLGYFDQRLMLVEPTILQSRVMDYCMGRNRDDYTPCRNWVEKGGYCKLHVQKDEGPQPHFKKRRLESVGRSVPK